MLLEGAVLGLCHRDFPIKFSGLNWLSKNEEDPISGYLMKGTPGKRRGP